MEQDVVSLDYEDVDEVSVPLQRFAHFENSQS